MKKDLIIFITSFDTIIAWIGTHSDLKIHGFTNKKDADNWIFTNRIGERYCNFGIFNDCSLEIIRRILKAEEIL